MSASRDGSGQKRESEQPSNSDAMTAQRLGQALARDRSQPVTITDLRRLTGGATQEIWAFTAMQDTPRRLVMRRALNGQEVLKETAVGLANEARVQIAAADAGVPVAKVVRVLEPSDELGPGFIMEHVEGETIPRKILNADRFAAARSVLARQCGESLARLHGVRRSDRIALRFSDAGGELDQYRRNYLKQGHPHPVFELAFRWLQERRPAVFSEPVLVHGDFRMGNLMIGETGLRAVLDWEISHWGDPMEDLGWICVPSWRFGNLDLPVGGFGSREALFAAYEEAGGKVDRERVRYWEILGTLKWGVMCATMAMTFTEGTDPSVERGTIARRSSEAELDLLHLLAGKGV